MGKVNNQAGKVNNQSANRLTADERERWDELVREGRKILKPKLLAAEAEKEESKEERRRALAALAGVPVEAIRGRKPSMRTLAKRFGVNLWDTVGHAVPPIVVRFVLARAAGIPLKRASEMSGCTWEQFMKVKRASEEVRSAVEAMHASSKELMKEMAYSTMEEALKGNVTNTIESGTAKLVLERMEGGEFADPKTRQGILIGGPNGPAVGGIVINLIDTSKPYQPPAIAAESEVVG